MRKVEKIPLSAAAFPVDGRRKLLYNNIVPAGMAELADAPDLGSGGALHAGSTPVARTSEKRRLVRRFFVAFLSKKRSCGADGKRGREAVPLYSICLLRTCGKSLKRHSRTPGGARKLLISKQIKKQHDTNKKYGQNRIFVISLPKGGYLYLVYFEDYQGKPLFT